MMKALILAAGFGTRLKPHTGKIPKSLFPVAGTPNLDRIIRRLIRAGCKSVVINTHHLHGKIKEYILGQQYPADVMIRHEPEILGTGGAVKNLADFWDSDPFFVVNGDVVADIDFGELYRFHASHADPATLVVCDDPEFNTVVVDESGCITAFSPEKDVPETPSRRLMTFTGIQVVDPVLLANIPENRYSESIQAYEGMLAQHLKIRAYMPEHLYWQDIGTPERYRKAAFDMMAAKAFQTAFPDIPPRRVTSERLKGDGSDRIWRRVKSQGRSLILADHGLRPAEQMDAVLEVDAFIAIGRHLRRRRVPVPEIILSDPFSGLVFLEDLGDLHLTDAVMACSDREGVISLYQTVIDHLIRFSVNGSEGFDPAWTCQTTHYDRQLIIEKECRYFTDAFLNAYMGMDIGFEEIENDCRMIADMALANAVSGFMHRDMQSKNIMVKDGKCFFIDFQGGRRGPFQYDLASLLIDPYVALPEGIRTRLLRYAFEKFSAVMPVSEETFYRGYDGCSVTRNLQILGAFAFLSMEKKKPWFERYIPSAVKTLKENLARLDLPLSRLRAIVQNVMKKGVHPWKK